MWKRLSISSHKVFSIALIFLFCFLSTNLSAVEDEQTPPLFNCIGQITALEELEGNIYAGSEAGLFLLSPEKNYKPEPVKALERNPVRNLSKSESSLILTYGNFKSYRLQSWNDDEMRFHMIGNREKSALKEEKQYHKGFLISDNLYFNDKTYTATRGGGVYVVNKKIDNMPDFVTALLAAKEGILTATTDGLYLYDESHGLTELFKNKARDCRITSLAKWKNRVYAGTLGGGVYELPAYNETGRLEGLSARINSLSSSADHLFIGTEAGIFTWNGSVITERSDISDEAVKAMEAVGEILYFVTPTGLKRYLLKTGKLTDIAPQKGAFMKIINNNIYIGGMYGLWQINLEKDLAGTKRILSENVTSIAELENELYVTGYYSGLWKISDSHAEMLLEGHYTAGAAGINRLFLGTGDEGLLVYHATIQKISAIPNFLYPTDNVTVLFNDKNNLYVGTSAGYASIPLKTLEIMSVREN